MKSVVDVGVEAPTQGEPRPANAPEAASSGPKGLPGKLAGLSLSRQVCVLAIWPFLEQLMNFLVGVVDLSLAGRLETNAQRLAGMDAIGVAGYFVWLMSLLQSAVGVGAAALVARAIGARHRRLANASLGQALVLAVCSGFAAGAALIVGADAIGHWLKLSDQAQPLSSIYLRILGISAPASAILLVGAACLRGAGDTRSPFFAMLTVNVVNLAASVLFVFGPAPIGGHGVAGIAAGSALAWLVGAVIIVGILLSGTGAIRLHVQRLRPHWHTTRRITRVGVPNLLESGGMWLINLVVLVFVGRLGVDGAFGAHMIAIRVEAISYLPGFALGIAAATLTGQYLGLGDPGRAKRAALMCCWFGVAVMSVMGVVLLVVPRWLVWIVSPETPEHLELSPQLLRICGPIQPFFAAYLILGHAMRGAGDTKATMKLSWASQLSMRLAGSYVLGVVLNGGLLGIWIALCGDLALRGLLFTARFVHGGWAKIRV